MSPGVRFIRETPPPMRDTIVGEEHNLAGLRFNNPLVIRVLHEVVDETKPSLSNRMGCDLVVLVITIKTAKDVVI
jgi:hypothetical protein